METYQPDNWIKAEGFIRGLVSVIIPNYNHARYLPDAIDSILEQSYSNYEIIVIDDGSTDNSREVAAAYGDKIRYVYKDNAGLSAARNTGICLAQGEFIGLLDADDMYEPIFMEKMVGILQNRPDVDGVYCGYQFVTDDGERLSQIENRVFPEEELYKVFWGANYWVPESVLMRRKCYVTAGPYDESLTALEDWDVWLRILKKHRVTGTSDVLIRHRVLPNSMSSDANKMHRNRLTVLKNRFGTLSEPDAEMADHIDWIYGNAFFTAVIEYLQFGDESRAFEMFKNAAEADPALITREGVYYELAAGSQPKGDRGDLSHINLGESEKLLRQFMSRLFESGDLSFSQSQQNNALSLVYLALSKFAYAGGNNRQVRTYLRQAVQFDNRHLKSAQLLSLFAKSFVGLKAINRLKGKAGHA